MTYKSILTVAVRGSGTAELVSAAGGIARRLDGHLDILSLGIDHSQIGYSYVGAAGVLVQVAQDHADADARSVEAAARQAIAELPDGLRWSIEAAIVQLGSLGDLLGRRARFADLVVLPRPYAEGRGVADEALVEAALFNGMAPVLVLPEPLRAKPPEGRRIVVAWNQSREAMVAARKALPFLQSAEMVSITVIDPPAHGPERSDPGGALCQMLVRHGVKAEVAVLARTLPGAADVLARHARDLDADMIVMGAYGHSRFREAVLGGATRRMLETAEVPLFLAH